MKKTIIQIAGEAGTGKTVIAHILNEALQARGFKTEVQIEKGTEFKESPEEIPETIETLLPGLTREVELKILTLQTRATLPDGITRKEFKVFRRSSNVNSFGLHGIWIMDREGKCWEFAINELNMKGHNLDQRGNVVSLQVDKYGDPQWATFGAECPEEKERPPTAVTEVIWTKPVEEW